jgi:hypothetical protein
MPSEMNGNSTIMAQTITKIKYFLILLGNWIILKFYIFVFNFKLLFISRALIYSTLANIIDKYKKNGVVHD